MPYEYRKMTPEERKNIVLYRKSQGYPLHSPPHPIREPGFYFISAACFEHAPILASPGRRSEFEARLISSLQSAKINLDAWVVLSTHYHVLIEVRSFDQVPPFFQRLHNGTAYEWNREDGCTGRRRVWFHYYDRFIRDETQYFQTLNYIHFNPVKHGLVEDPYAWEWSSLAAFLEIEGKEWLRTAWTKYSPDKFQFGDFD